MDNWDISVKVETKNIFIQYYSLKYAVCKMEAFLNTLKPWQNGRNFAENIFKCFSLNGNLEF